MTGMIPIAEILWNDAGRLIGGRGTDGWIRFPMPQGTVAIVER